MGDVGNAGHFSDRVQFTTEKRLHDNPSYPNSPRWDPDKRRSASPDLFLRSWAASGGIGSFENGRFGLTKRRFGASEAGFRAEAKRPFFLAVVVISHFKMVRRDLSRLQHVSNGDDFFFFLYTYTRCDVVRACVRVCACSFSPLPPLPFYTSPHPPLPTFCWKCGEM